MTLEPISCFQELKVQENQEVKNDEESSKDKQRQKE